MYVYMYMYMYTYICMYIVHVHVHDSLIYLIIGIYDIILVCQSQVPWTNTVNDTHLLCEQIALVWMGSYS